MSSAKIDCLLRSLLCLALSLYVCSNIHAKEGQADVVVVIDTSLSMLEVGMDPERTSVLVAKLFSDVVPSSLSIVRLLDLEKDKHIVKTRKTGKMTQCPESAGMCENVEFVDDIAEISFQKKIGAFSRPKPRDVAFKSRLETELTATATTSPFSLALISAERIFEDQALVNPNARQLLVWLSDGRTDNVVEFRRRINKLMNDGVEVRSVIFGNGSTTVSTSSGIPHSVAKTPLELMTIFADILRQIVGAPIDSSGKLARDSSFEVPAEIEQAWIIAYGDNSLSSATLTSPDGRSVAADYASDSQGHAGSYKVAYLNSPKTGKWLISASGGGPEAAYAVILDSSLYPFLLSSGDFIVNTPGVVEVNIKSTLTDQVVNDSAVVGHSTINASLAGVEYSLSDLGLNGDRKAGDFVFSGKVTINNPGVIQLKLTLTNEQTKTSRQYELNASGYFNYVGSGLRVDFGDLRAADTICRKATVSDIELQGNIPIELAVNSGNLPSGHSLYIRQDAQSPGVVFNTGSQALEICLALSRFATTTKVLDSSVGELRVSGSQGAGSGAVQSIPILATWNTTGLSFWELWKKWIYLILVILFIAFVVAGFILPKRFRSSLNVVTGDSVQELNENIPTQIKSWRGTSSGFYRNAKAFIYSDHRISGKNTNAAVSITIDNHLLIIAGANGYTLHKKALSGDWEPIADGSYRMGNPLRIGTDGLIFKLVDV